MEIVKYEGYNKDELLELYRSVGWTNYVNNPAMLEKAFKNSLATFAAYEAGILVGIIRAVGDGASIVFIQDIIVLPEYQSRGIGTMLLKHITEMYSDVYQIELMTDDTEKTIAFYESCGFKRAAKLGCCAFMRI